MAEKLAFEQRFDHGGAVQDYKVAFRNWTEPMKRSCDEILTCPSRSGDQNRTKMRSDAPDPREQMPHGWAVAHHAFEARCVDQFRFDVTGPLSPRCLFEQCIHSCPQSVKIHRLV